ncbi:Beauvericin nonribosomal cyclodepsipeptide synthetase bea1 [Fusarium musae]|uniref:Beauvericin nonribosomal cyclodepsipeptide synthetase bea1 n=1 Tax=Fusarium musae TaxID=1042133 RepID=A0A9P8D6W9_9HYPO|nr:Beauvericin nonribosomal cyclodepsipeptide synthetase bea1 [Fusarium musae]KAG9496487.1 Beauvericin nonribosomal cyclodepsipeptide synthetase bea1 [Fusarium musae]
MRTYHNNTSDEDEQPGVLSSSHPYHYYNDTSDEDEQRGILSSSHPYHYYNDTSDEDKQRGVLSSSHPYRYYNDTSDEDEQHGILSSSHPYHYYNDTSDEDKQRGVLSSSHPYHYHNNTSDEDEQRGIHHQPLLWRPARRHVALFILITAVIVVMAKGEYDPESFFVCFMSVLNAGETTGRALSFGPNVAQVRAAANRILGLRDSQVRDGPEATGAPFVSHGDGMKIELDNIHFKYPTRDVPVFQGLSLTIEKGQFAPLVGASGSGKSSIVSLLERFYDPDHGRILCNGQDIAANNVYTYRRHLSLVTQESSLFQGTLRENILLGVEDTVDDANVHRICQEASIHEFIVSLPEGYRTQLDNITSRLAALIKFSTPDQEHAILPIYLQKSKWVVASMLAVLKAGHAFTLIDPNDPPARVAQVVGQTGATVSLTSKLYSSKVRGIVGRCIVIDDELVQSLICTCASKQDLVLAAVAPEDLAYVIFTSGSTGDPKGIMIEHRAFSAYALKFGSALGINSDTRALQFGSHAFGAFLLEIMTTLIHGGCVCIPSDDDRMNNFPAFVNRANVNWMMATPSYMETFQPDDVPGLQTLVLVGEQMSPSVNAIWAPSVQLLDDYGQSESSSICFVGSISSSGVDSNNIGHSVGAHSWITDPSDPNRLVPIGAIGELVIESPGISRDYIIPPPTKKSPFFSTVPAWYPSKHLPDGLKFYRTGDLARYASDGTVVCLGRIDSQVKIRGQRVELGAVETHLRQQLPDDMSIVVEAVKTSDSPTSTVLVAFLIASHETKAAGDGTILDLAATKDISAKLEQVLSRHSIPSCYISMQHLPRTATGKVNRRKLRSIGSELLAQQPQGTSPQPSQLSCPANSSQSKLEEVWCQCLGLEPSASNIGSTFFELGGHSITAIKMVNMARSTGIELKVSDIYKNPTLAGLETIINGSAVPYALIPATTRDGPVEQSYPQGRLWFLDQLEVGALWYLIPYAVRMRGLVDVDALSRALMALEQRHETLRTTFEDRDGAGVQIIHQTLSKELRIVEAIDGDYLRLLEQEQTTPFDLTSEAGWRALLIRLTDTDYVLSIVMHHIISDGWSIDVLRHDLSQLYAAALQGHDPLSAMNPLPIQYSDFAMWQKQEAQALKHEKQLDYWKKQLADCSPAKLPTDFPRPALLSGEAGVVPVSIDGELYHNLRDFCNENNTTSFAVLLATFRAAHYRLTGVDDAVIGTPIANRNRWELENIIGFFVNTQCMLIN